MNSTRNTPTIARITRAATVGGVALMLALSGNALAQDVPPDLPSDGPPVVELPPDATPPAEDPAAEDPKTEEPAVEQPAEQQPAEQQPADRAPVVEQPGTTPETPAVVDQPPPAKPAKVAKKKAKPCKNLHGKKLKRCKKHHKVTAKRTGVFARSAMQGVTLGSATCTGQQYQKTMNVTAPTVASGQPFQWIAHYNTIAKWNGSIWAVDSSNWVGPFYTRTDYPGYVYYNGAWSLRSNGGGSSNHYVGNAYAVGVQWVKGLSSNVVEYQYLSTTDNMSVTGAPVHWCNG